MKIQLSASISVKVSDSQYKVNKTDLNQIIQQLFK
jgi:hypothetical protein